MSRALILVNGIPRMTELSSISELYDDSYSVVAPISSGANITLPNAGTYNSKDLRVFLNGSFLEKDTDYAWVGTAPRTQIQILMDLSVGDTLHFRSNVDINPLTIYDEVIAVGATITTGTNITLPGGQTYNDIDLEIYLNGQLMEDVIDYNYVGALPPRTQIQMTFDLVSGDRLRFRMGD